ncbi:galactose mutarotase [Planctomycetales bacterium ZRK34]|nr:galactose mutarotase [Planctomycetales bacterium ZRK34]
MQKSSIAVQTDWGAAHEQTVELYTLTNAHGVTAKITNYGAIITELHLPDRDGKMADCVLGFDSLDGYLAGHPYFGTIAGRYANRIAKGKFTLNGKKYQLATNNETNHLHGGDEGFDKKVWDAEPMMTDDGPSLKLTLVSPDGDQNYPGKLTVTVIYTLTDANELIVDMSAITDAPTIINLAQHTYWNLAGQASGNVLDQVLELNADYYTPTDDTLITTGDIVPVKDTPYDFTSPKPIGKDIDALRSGPGKGYDINFVVNGDKDQMRYVGSAFDPASGRQLDLWANQPGVQFYSGNFLDGSNVGKGETVYNQHQGFCLETQHYPDSPNKPDWPGVVLKPGETYHHKMLFMFTTR